MTHRAANLSASVTKNSQPARSKPIRIEPINLPAIGRTVGLLRPSWWLASACPTYQDSQWAGEMYYFSFIG